MYAQTTNTPIARISKFFAVLQYISLFLKFQQN